MIRSQGGCDMSNLSIGTLAAAAGVHVESIRFYQRKGLLAEPSRLPGSIRRYGSADLARLRFIKAAKGLGFDLKEVAQLLKLADGTHCSEAAGLASRHLANIRNRLRDLQRMEDSLQTLLEACKARPGNISCPLIEALQEDELGGRT